MALANGTRPLLDPENEPNDWGMLTIHADEVLCLHSRTQIQEVSHHAGPFSQEELQGMDRKLHYLANWPQKVDH